MPAARKRQRAGDSDAPSSSIVELRAALSSRADTNSSDSVDLRASLLMSARAPVTDCRATGPEGVKLSPIVVCARHKAQAIYAEIDNLSANKEAARTQLEETHAAALAGGRAVEEVTPLFETRVAELEAAAASKRKSLETEAVTMDATLASVLAIVDDISTVRH